VQYPQAAREDWLNAIVTFRNGLGPGLMTLQVAPVDWLFPEFQPGQYVTLGLFASSKRSTLAAPELHAPAPERLIRRPYSIASPPENREVLEFYINLVPAGALTPRLFQVTAGDRISLGSKVAGSFTLSSVPEDANLILIATGTGVAPYISMLTSNPAFRKPRRIALLHGVRQSRDLGYRSVLTALQRDQPAFTYVPVVSHLQSEASPWAGAVGHVQDVWKRGVLKRSLGFCPKPENTHVLLCGNPAMIESMISLLAGEGFQRQTPRQPGQVHFEKFWQANTPPPSGETQEPA